MKKAIILGASGLIGNHLLQIILNDSRYAEVISIGRRELDIAHSKLKQVTGDLFDMPAFKNAFINGDELFIAIGTTKAKTPDKTKYKAIDYGIPVAAANLAKECSIETVAVVSSMGANAKSTIFYSALKGQMEDELKQLNFEKLVIVRPSLLLGERDENRAGESISAFLMTKLDFIIPTKIKAIKGEQVAKAMVKLVNSNNKKVIFMNDELHEIDNA